MGFFKTIKSSHNLYRAILVNLLLMPLIQGCTDNNNAAKSHQSKQHVVQVQTAKLQDIRLHYNTSAIIEAVQSLQISNQLVAKISQIKVDVGDHVKQGDALIMLDASIAKAELIKSQAALEQAKLNLKRLKNLAQNKLSSDDEIAKAKTAISIAQADVSLQEKRYSYSHIVAPFSGVISQRLVNEGDVVSLHQHLLTLINTQQLKVKASLSANIIPKLQVGDESILDCNGIKQHNTISRIYPSIEVASQQGQIEIQWQNIQHNLLPGQLCQITIISQASQRLMIPNQAIQYDSHGAYVYTATQTANKTPIVTGLALKHVTEVLTGLEKNARVITAGLLNLVDGKKIKIQQAQ